MPLNLRGKTYIIPNEGNQPSPSGAEIIEIEDYFGLDGLRLLSSLQPSAVEIKGYTKTKALYAIAWIALRRAGEVLSLEDILNDYNVEEIATGFSDNPKEVAESSSVVEPTVSSEKTSPSSATPTQE